MPIATIRLLKKGLFRGLKTRFYTWSNGEPPRDVMGLSPVAETISSRVEFIWVDRPHENVPPRGFIVEFKGFLKVDEPGRYRFYVISRDGVVFSLNGEVLIDAWFDQPPRMHSTPEVHLSRGYKRIRLLHYNRTGISEIVLGWVKPSGVAEVVPGEHLYFSLGEHVFILGLPDGYMAKLVPLHEGLPEEKCVFSMNICMFKVPWEHQPLEAYLSIYDASGKPFTRFSEPLVFFGGDEYVIEFT